MTEHDTHGERPQLRSVTREAIAISWPRPDPPPLTADERIEAMSREQLHPGAPLGDDPQLGLFEGAG